MANSTTKSARTSKSVKTAKSAKPAMTMSQKLQYELPVARVSTLMRKHMPRVRHNPVAVALVTHAMETLMTDVLHHSWDAANGRKQLTPQFIKRGLHAMGQTHGFVNELWTGEIRDAGVIPLDLPKRLVAKKKSGKSGKTGKRTKTTKNTLKLA